MPDNRLSTSVDGARARRMRLWAPLWSLGLVVSVLGVLLTGLPVGGPLTGQEREEAEAAEPAAPDPIARYLAVPAPEPESAEAALDRLEAAIELWQGGQRREGARLAGEALALIPTLADWAPLIRAELLAAAGDTAEVVRALALLDPETGFLDRWGWRFGVQAFTEARDPRAARSYAEYLARSELGEAAAGAAWIRVGDLAIADRDTVAAVEAYRSAFRTTGVPGVRGSAALRVQRLQPALEPEDRLELGQALLAAGEWEAGERLILPFISGSEGSRVDRAALRVALGRALVELGRNSEALAMLAPLTGELTPAELAVPALFWSGRARLGMNDAAAAEEAFLRLARRAPESALAETGIFLVLERELERASETRSAQLAQALFTVGVSTAGSELHAVRFGTASYLRGDYQSAARTFEAYLEGSRRGAARQQAGYWAGLAHDRAGDRGRADERFREVHAEDPLSFYGVFAGERLGVPVLAGTLDIGPAAVPGIRNELENAILRLRAHQLVPTSGSFAHELERLTEHFFRRGDGAYDFAEALLEGGFPVQGIVLGREIHRREGEWNLRLLRIVHPFPYRDVIVREARARGLDPFFVAGLIRQESAFHTSIRSSAGAIGLMQLVPATAREVAQASGIRYSEAALSNPEINIRLGTSFLSTMLNRFDGRAEDALSAYNAGPTRIRQWRQRPEYRDRDVFIESIPFRETRHYVKVVQQYTRIYTALYGCGDFEPCLGLSYAAAHARSPAAGSAPGTAVAR